MPRLFRALLVGLMVLMWLPAVVLADPGPPTSIVSVQILDYGIYCRPVIDGTTAAPGTPLGYVNNFSGAPTYRYRQQEVPALLGISFGLSVVSDISIANVRVETLRPGATAPDVWFTDLEAGSAHARGFSFDFEDELQMGLWKMEAWDGDTRLYSIEFDVVAPSALPEIGPDCNFLS
ncbi:MAG: hypothetical protein WAT09_15810 [Paracoccaceae bacterium]